MIKCNSSYGFGKCIVEMDGQQTHGGCIVCDIAEECNFERDTILKRCKAASYIDQCHGLAKDAEIMKGEENGK